MKSSVFPMILTALCAAIIAVLAQIIIPLPLIPITGQTLAIGLVVTILGLKHGTYAVLLYILLGAIGLPVFQSFTGGLGILFGPTGGYIIGFIPTALVIGFYLEKTRLTFTHALVANILGMLVTLAFGAVWLKYVAELSWTGALLSGVIPFLIAGVIKAILAAWVGVIVRQRLEQANILRTI
ncbi:MAG: biotin transporter BioY [Lysinibacillus sp.]